ncbi:MAG: hypothetical protein ABSH05_20600 [Bryobacteraceae bacterium]
MRKYFPYAVLLAEVLVFYRHVLFYPGYVFPWDLRYFHYPHAWFIAESFRNFDLPLWDPFTYFGRPFQANIQTQVLYPPLALLIVLRNLLGGDLLYFLECHVVLHVFLGGVFAYWLLKRLGAGVPAALLGATVYQLGGFFPAHVEHMGAVCTAAWIPLAWLSVISLRDSRRWLPVLAFALAMSVFAGHTPLTAVVFASTLLLSVLLVLFREAPRRLPLLALAGCAWAALMAAVQLLPTIQLSGLSIAQYRTDWLKSGGGVPLQSLVSLVWPDYYNIFDLSRYSFHGELSFMYLYCGVLGLALALGAALLRRRRQTILFSVMTVVWLLVMLGDSTPLGRAASLLLPASIRNALHPEFAAPCFILGIAVLAGLGAEGFFRLRPLAYGAVALAALDLILVGSGRPMNAASVAQEPGVSHDSFQGSTMDVERLRMLAGRSFPPARIDTIDSSQNWAMAAPLLEIPSANGNDPMALARAIQVRLAFCRGERWGAYYQVTQPESPVLDLVNVRYLLSREPVAGLTPITRLRQDYVYENPKALPRFFLVNRIRAARSMEEAVRLLHSPDFDPRREAIVENLGTVTMFPDSAPLGRVKVLRYEPRTVVVEVDTPAPAFLVTSEAHYPGWRAFTEDRELAFHYTNVAFRGLPVPAGRHLILMRFAPPLFKRAAALSALAWLAVAVFIVVPRRRRPAAAQAPL